MWQNGGYAGADVIAANNGRLPDFDTGNNLIDKSNGSLALKYGGTYR